MWYYDSTIIKTPKAITIDGITHPAAIFADSSRLSGLGIKPYSEVLPDNRYYTYGSYSVDTSGSTVVGTTAGVAKDLATLRAGMLERTNAHVAGLLEKIDWYWARAAKGGTAVPSNIASYATAVYSEHETKKTEIAGLNTLAKIIEYEARAYTETQKERTLNDDGSFKEYHASNTYTVPRKVDMCTYFSVNPNEVDAGLVSLTAD
jgi:hypothetical protein